MIQADSYPDLLRISLMVTILTGLGLVAWPGACLSQAPTKPMTVIVDPGHGGQETGGKASAGVFEKELTLTLARTVAQILEETGTIHPVLTRTDDYSISLDDRAGAANHRGGDLLVSLHVGDSFQPVSLGFSVYYWSPVTAAPSMSPTTDQSLPWDQEQRLYWESSRKLATLIQQQLLESLSWSTGSVVQADLYLLRRVRMPAVLLELGSLNHPGEAGELQRPEFQKAVANALAEAINKFRDEQEQVKR